MNPVLARKLGQSSLGTPETGDAVMTPMRVMRRAMARAADKSVGLSASVLGISDELSSAEEMIADAPQDWVVLGMRNGDEAGLTGLFLIDPVLRSALVEIQVMGNLLPVPEKQRPVTGTDSTMCMPFAVKLLSELSLAGFGTEDVQVGTYDIGPIEDIRTASLVLTQGHYRYWRISIQIGGTETQGELLIALQTVVVASEPQSNADNDWSEAFQKSVSEARAEMDAVLTTLQLPISAAEALEVGQVIKLPGTTVGSVTLTGSAGETIAQARLGQVAGKRAVRIETPTMYLEDTEAVRPDIKTAETDKSLIDS